MSKCITFLLSLLLSITVLAQQKSEIVFDGQLSILGNYAPDNSLAFLFGGRYLPELNYIVPLDSTHKMDFVAAANIFGNVNFSNFSSAHSTGALRPYRLWARFSSKQLEIRVGLQKIDFGAAAVLRPLQWFNRVNPRDPLEITDGVYAALGRYYFLNNANIWLWVLYGNEGTKGFEIVPTNQGVPEVGGRFQYPIPRGELGVAYHYRTAGTDRIPQRTTIPESRYGLDVKWDLTIGLWLEASHIRKSKYLDLLTYQTLINVGADYTFGIGNGLNIAVEHLVNAYDKQAFVFERSANITAITLNYPIGLFDSLSALITCNWEARVASAFLNYAHQFKKLTGYIMLFYNPTMPTGLVQNKAEYAILGPGVRLMLVYNH